MDNVRRSGGIEKESIISMSNYKEDAEFIKNFLDGADCHYEMQDHGILATFCGGIGGFKGLYNSFRFVMFVEDDVAQNYATLPVSFKDELPQMAEFITRANYGLKYGAFEMNYDNGDVRFHLTFPMAAIRADKMLLQMLLAIPAQMLDKYAKGFSEVFWDLKTPEEAIKDCEMCMLDEIRAKRDEILKTPEEAIKDCKG